MSWLTGAFDSSRFDLKIHALQNCLAKSLRSTYLWHKASTRPCKLLLTDHFFLSTYTTCWKISLRVLCQSGQIRLFLLGWISGAAQEISTDSQVAKITLPNHRQQPRHLWLQIRIKKNVNVFLRKLRIEQLNFCFFYEQQAFMKDTVIYVQLALQNTSQRLHKRGSQFRINPNPYQREHANSLRYQNSNMTPRL